MRFAAVVRPQYRTMYRANRSRVVIRHIVFFTAQPDRVEAVADGLRILGDIPHHLHFEIGRNEKVDLYGNTVDVIVYAEFADEKALTAYKAHPLYAEATKKVRPLRELRYAADFKAQDRAEARIELKRSA